MRLPQTPADHGAHTFIGVFPSRDDALRWVMENREDFPPDAYYVIDWIADV